MDSCICEVFKSSRRDEMYLYIDKRKGLSAVPEALLAQFGKPVSVMTLRITRERALARVDVGRVLDKLEEQGFYLQMPPPREDYLLDLLPKGEGRDLW